MQQPISAIANESMPADMAAALSALIDGELSEAQSRQAIGQIVNDDALRDRWLAYYVAADNLHFPSQSTLADRPFLQRFSAALAAEPVHMSGRVKRLAALPGVLASRHVARYAMPALAASCAIIAVAWMALPTITGSDTERRQLAAINSSFISAVPDDSVIETPTTPTVAMQDYMLAHQHLAPSMKMQGMAPFVRVSSIMSASSRVQAAATQ